MAFNFIKNTLQQLFCCNIREIFKNTSDGYFWFVAIDVFLTLSEYASVSICV